MIVFNVKLCFYTGLVLSRRDKFSSGYHFNQDEKLLLDTVFTYNPNPNQTTTQDIAEKLAVSREKVTNWFGNRRARLKREKTQAMARCLEGKHLPSCEQMFSNETIYIWIVYDVYDKIAMPTCLPVTIYNVNNPTTY